MNLNKANWNQFIFQMEVLDENEWWNKIEQWKTGGEQEMLIKRNFSRGDQQTLSDMAYQLGLYLYVYLLENFFLDHRWCVNTWLSYILHDLALVTYAVFKLFYKPCIFLFSFYGECMS